MTQDLNAIEWPLTTPRLSLRPTRVADIEAVFEIRRRPDVHEWLGSAFTDLDAFRAEFDQPARLASSIVMEHDGRIVGDLILRIEEPWAQVEVAEQAKGTQAEIGWVLDPAHAGRGLASEAVAALVDAAFGSLGLRRLVAHCFADNAPSWRLMERLGMRRETHTVKDSLHRTKGWLDGYSYGLLAEEWQSASIGSA